MKIAKVDFSPVTGFTWSFANGVKRTINPNTEFTADIWARLVDHGAKQKLTDVYASASTVSEAIERFDNLLAAMKAGDWTVGRSTAAGGVWVEAFARATERSIEEAAKVWAEQDKKTQKAIQKHPDVKIAKLAIDIERAERKTRTLPTQAGKEKIDLDALMGEAGTEAEAEA